MSDERKTRGDSVIDTQLSGAEQDAFFVFCEGGEDSPKHTLKDGSKWLYDQKLIELSPQAVGKWLEKRRKEADDFQFARVIAEIGADAARAEAFGQKVDALQIEGITKANVAMLSQALFRAQREKDPMSIKFFTMQLTGLLEAVAKQESSKASVISAEVARDRFQFDAAKRALEEAAALQKINEDTGSSREKIDRAVERLFGRRPGTTPASSLIAAGKSDAGSQTPTGTPSNVEGSDDNSSSNIGGEL